MSREAVDAVKKVVRSALSGLAALSAVNLAAAFTGVSLGFSWLSGGIAMALGIPGVVSMLLVNAIMIV